MDWAATLEAQPFAQALRASRWTYPLVNAGHILGLALLIGAVVPMDVRLLRGDLRAIRMLRVYAIGGLCLALACGSLLFAAQASDYVTNSWFRWKIALLVVALVNAALHLHPLALSRPRQCAAAILSLCLWIAVLLCGRMIAYS
ncbi:hypothetical protein KZZ08_00905 [Roseovarius mucosus]|uniref:hypothetical protein n=1 Tax=Roseovarius mucosus TaxID=215743 RepID=UPI001C600A8E|nr:hypothetical protein [Roseovarius mucosus]MBW4972154.1 hypothetical protein [Roseovarius mucosus]